MGRAAIGNLPFDDSFVADSVLAVRRAGYRCEISGRPFDIDYRTSGAGGTHYAPSPDRIVPARGYVRGNVRWVLWCLNRGKGEMSADDYLEVCRLVAGHRAKASHPYGDGHDAAGHGGSLGTSAPPQTDGFTIQQIAAFKAHITMLRRSLAGLSGFARANALEKLEYQEARLATALARLKA